MTRPRIFRIGILAAVSLLVLGLAVPAGAKKGGIPGPPSGSVLDVTVAPTSGFMWANSVGDEIEFEITITNTGSNTLKVTSATFDSDPFTDPDPETPPVDCEGQVIKRNDLCKTHHVLMVQQETLTGLPLQQQSTVELIDIVKVNADVVDEDGSPMLDEDGNPVQLEETETATFTAYPVAACNDPVVFEDVFGLLEPDEGFWWGPFDDYTVCAYAFDGADTWMLTTLLPKKAPGKSMPPSATIRDGVPGNWCQEGNGYVDGQMVVDIAHFPENGTCLRGGAGGEPIPIRNTTTHYLATWAGNTVTATPCPVEESCP